MTPQELKNSILQLAIQGKLVDQRPEEGTAEELYREIQKEKQALIREGKIKKEKPLPDITEEELPFEIPETWKWVRWGDLSESIQYGYNAPAQESGCIKMVRISDIQDGRVLWDSVPYCDIPEKEIPTYLLTANDILFARTGGTVGKSYLVKDVPEESIYAGYLIRTRYSSHLCPEYMKCFMESQLYWDQLHSGTIATAQPNCNGKTLSRMILPLPPLAEQKRIVAKIEELLPLIDRYEKAWTRLEDFNKRFPDDMQKSILQMAIQGKLVDQRPEEGTGEELYQQIQKEKQAMIKAGKIKKEKNLPEIAEEELPFEIPETWKWTMVGAVCVNIQYGSSQKSSPSGKIPVLRMGNIQNGRIVYDKLVYTSDDAEIDKYPLTVNDLLFNRTNSKELVGKTAIYKGEMPAIYAGYLVRVTPVLLDSDYLNFVMQSQYYWTYCQTVRSDAIGQSNINAEKLKRFIFPLPPLAEQKRIVARLEELLPLCEKLK